MCFLVSLVVLSVCLSFFFLSFLLISLYLFLSFLSLSVCLSFNLNNSVPSVICVPLFFLLKFRCYVYISFCICICYICLTFMFFYLFVTIHLIFSSIHLQPSFYLSFLVVIIQSRYQFNFVLQHSLFICLFFYLYLYLSLFPISSFLCMFMSKATLIFFQRTSE